MDPVTQAALITAGGSLLSSLFGGGGPPKWQEAVARGGLKLNQDELALKQKESGQNYGQTLRGNRIEDVEIGHKRGNATAMSPYVRQLLAAVMGKIGQAPGAGILNPSAAGGMVSQPLRAPLPAAMAGGGASGQMGMLQKLMGARQPMYA